MIKLLAFTLAFAIAAGADQRISALIFDPAIPQSAFAANEITAAAGVSIPQFSSLQNAKCAPCVVISSAAGGVPQSYRINRTQQVGRDVISVIGADANGAMYGGLDIAEAVRLQCLEKVVDSVHAPHIAKRGIKFNIPLDVRTPSYSDNADAAQSNIPEMWSFDFWREFIDEMARHRYNTLSLWNLHPFPSLVKVPEFSRCGIARREADARKDGRNLLAQWNRYGASGIVGGHGNCEADDHARQDPFLARRDAIREGSRRLYLHHHLEHFHFRHRWQVRNHPGTRQFENYRILPRQRAGAGVDLSAARGNWGYGG